ncbi:hypothetical protein LCGC14_1785310 [marine sediment metagenome]|uniref:Disease resistance R13L4/SHOC-2-like LRR domain-containing protein n=1 Tax=marine sediment metagenome TaxID=412755 RepID=A0A0F9J943_9ZZZZ|nr:leucine-rich repeat domain-containing protein [bacterium]
MIEFDVNEYIKLKLEKGITNIYIKNQLFNHCKRVMIKKNLEDLENIESIDELIDNALPENSENDYGLFSKELREIKPEEEFWAHCSAFQMWAEKNYDSLFLHRNLSFPLLKKLVEIGDRKAKHILKDEIVKRLESGYHPVIEFLQREGYTKYIDRKELFSILLNYKELTAISKLFDGKLEEIVWFYGLDYELTFDYYDMLIFNKNVVGLNLSKRNLKRIHDEIGCFKKLLYLDLSFNKIKRLPKTIGKLESLKELGVMHNRLETVPPEIGQLKKLKTLFLDSNKIQTLPSSIGDLASLNKLFLDANYIKILPKNLGNLENLYDLGLSNNPFEDFPSPILEIKSIVTLSLDTNKLSNLDEKLLLLSNMEVIHLDEKFKNKKIVKKLIKNGVKPSFY